MKRIITIATLCCVANIAVAATSSPRENTHLKAVTDSIAAERTGYMETYAPEAPSVAWTNETCAGTQDLKCKKADSAWQKYTDEKKNSQKLKQTMVQSPALSTSKAAQKYVTDRTQEKKDYLQNHMPSNPDVNWDDTTCYKNTDLKCEKPNAMWDSVIKPATSP